jgi:hypothetical protein
MAKIGLIILTVSAVMVLGVAVGAQTTAFTYQGRLTDASLPPTGSYNMQFDLFPVPSGGTAVASQTVPGVSVTSGIFTVNLDFGSSVFDGSARFLEITVGPTTLVPRQPIASTPYAITARDVTSSNVARLSAENTFTAMKNTFGGKVGIGVTDPTAALEVQGDIIRTIARAQGYNQGDNTDNGPLAIGRLVNFTKRRNDTGLRVTYTDNIRVIGTGAAGRWEVKFNGVSAPLFPLAWDFYNGSSAFTHQPTTLVGTAFSLPAGVYAIRVYVGPSPSYPVSDLYTGWQGAWSLEVEEVR